MATTVTVKLRYLHISTRKVRSVADLIRGLSVNHAEAQLSLSPRRASAPILKLLRSGVASAQAVLKAEPKQLVIREVRVDQGPRMKRYTPRARGSMSKIERKTSHVTIVLGVVEATPKRTFTFRPKPKKEKEKESKSKRAPKAGEPHEHDHEPAAKAAPAVKRSPAKEGGWRRVFRRKAV